MKKLISSTFIFIASILFVTACSSAAGESVPPLTAQQAAQLYNPGGNAVLGNPKGDVTVVEFFDYQCPYCRKVAPALEQLIQQDPNVKVVFKEYLLFGPVSEPSARAALAAQKQGKYLPMHNALMAASPPLDNVAVLDIAKGLKLNTKKLAADMKSQAISNQIQVNDQLGNLLNIDAAPAFIIASSDAINNPQNAAPNKQVMLIGEASLEKLQELVAQVRK